MVYCWFIKRKLYDYAAKELDERAAQKIKAHSAKCKSCAKTILDYERIISGALAQEKPFFNEVFWRKFDERLDMRLSPDQPKNFAPGVNIFKARPARGFAYAFAAAGIILYLALVPLKNQYESYVRARQDQELVETILILDQVQVSVLNHDEEAYVDEMLLLMEFGAV